nr:histidine-rich glycoprotein-like [Coffea arabica]
MSIKHLLVFFLVVALITNSKARLEPNTDSDNSHEFSESDDELWLDPSEEGSNDGQFNLDSVEPPAADAPRPHDHHHHGRRHHHHGHRHHGHKHHGHKGHPPKPSPSPVTTPVPPSVQGPSGPSPWGVQPPTPVGGSDAAPSPYAGIANPPAGAPSSQGPAESFIFG